MILTQFFPTLLWLYPRTEQWKSSSSYPCWENKLEEWWPLLNFGDTLARFRYDWRQRSQRHEIPTRSMSSGGTRVEKCANLESLQRAKLTLTHVMVSQPTGTSQPWAGTCALCSLLPVLLFRKNKYFVGLFFFFIWEGRATRIVCERLKSWKCEEGSGQWSLGASIAQSQAKLHLLCCSQSSLLVPMILFWCSVVPGMHSRFLCSRAIRCQHWILTNLFHLRWDHKENK